MDTRTIQDLGFPTVLEELCNMCLSEEGRETLQDLEFITDVDKLAQRQDIVEDLMALGTYGKSAPVSFPSIRDSIVELKIPGGRLDGEQLYNLALYLDAARIFTEFCRMQRKLPGEAPGDVVWKPAMDLFTPFDSALHTLYKHLDDTLEAPGVVKSSHPAIARLVKEVERRRAERQTYSLDFLKRQNDASMNIQPVFRDGRVVLPVRNDQRSGTEGIIHSSSSSGATVFMEPYKLVELNNQVVMAQQQIQMEIARILAQLSQEVRDQLAVIEDLSNRISYADSLYARARYASKRACVRPIPSKDGTLSLIQARHPLLKDKAVPISIDLDPSIKAVVISGPNAGGKTVTIKTVGLFALMHQYFYFVPAAEGTVMPIFHAVYTDIGDEQSIEESLSTFSGHMRNIGEVLHACDSHSLVIFDELGSGTDPVEGSALARSILEYCVQKAALTLVTSHHSVLKQYAYAHENLLNASMEFNGETHEPTFRIISGLPGESHALDTARRMHLPEIVLEHATKYIGSELVEISTIIRGLEEKRREAEAREAALDTRAKKIQEQVRHMDLQQLKLKQQEQLLRKEQIGDLSRFISEKRSELENLVAELREGEITREKTLKVKDFIASMERQQVDSERKEHEVAQAVEAEASRGDSENITYSIGMDVIAGPHKREGRIVRKEKNGKWIVAIGPMKFPLHEKDLRPVSSKVTKDRKKVSISYDSRSVAPRPTIDVRGMTLDQAIEVVVMQIEGALVHSVGSFSIIHGMGDGILARGIHEYLRTVPQVTNYYFARPEDGGYGKTYVEF
ncbi:MAG: endonuclease MutS2 [Sphaerochaetaceae bacterium]